MIIDPASRLGEIQEYFFSRKLKEVERLRKAGKKIINLGIGSPDLPPHPSVTEALHFHALQPDQHGYQPYQGILALREAIATFSRRKFGVDLTPEEILPLMGSKEGITHISLAYLNPGDEVLIPSLGYPTYTSVTKIAGAIPIYYPLMEDKGWEPDWEFLERLDTRKVKLLWLNYPQMPTGARGSEALFTRFVDFARRKEILLCHDNPYSFILNERPLSLLAVAGAKEVAIELNSLSKTFNMAGWRVGWVSGHPEYLSNLIKIKSNMDSGMFRPIQQAAVCALESGEEWFRSLNEIYLQRRHLVFEILQLLTCHFSEEQSGMFVWARVPGGSGEELSDRLLLEKNVFITPGKIFGEAGNPYIRVSLCAPVKELEEVLKRLK